MDTEPVILSGHFELLPTKKIFFVSITRKSFVYKKGIDGTCPCVGKNRSASSTSIDLFDVYGAKAYRGPEEDVAGYFQVYSCPFTGKKRERHKLCFKITASNCAETNVESAERWVQTILWLVKEPEKDVTNIEGERMLPSARKLMILINPFSGSGKSVKVFHNQVEPMLNEAEIEYEQVITGYAGHAVEIMLSLNLLHVDGIVICSGDGLVYEVINGLMKRSDWETAIKIPIGVIPTGSGNALCLSSLYATGEPFDLTSAILSVIRGNLLDLDICSVVTPTETLYAFLSVTWGMVSDVDIESEKYRCLGETRFLIGTIAKILGLRVYRGRLSYLCEDHGAAETNLTFDTEMEETENSPSGSFDQVKKVGAPKEVPDVKEVVNLFKRRSVNGEYVDATSSSCQCQAPINHLLPPLGSALPSSWQVVEGEFILGCPVFLTHLGTDLMAHPDAKFGDGLIGIFFVKSGTGRMALMNLFGRMKDGSHVLSDHVTYAKAVAFRLEPDLNQPGTIAVDGERINYAPIQGQIHKSLARLMCVMPPPY